MIERYDDGTINVPYAADAPPYNPEDSTVSTLDKVVEKYVLEESGAYRQIVNLAVSNGSKPVGIYLRNKRKSENGLSVRKPAMPRIPKGNNVKATTRVFSKRGGVVTPPEGK